MAIADDRNGRTPNAGKPASLPPEVWLQYADTNYLRGWHPIPVGLVENDEDPSHQIADQIESVCV